jgi:hypothetical protein
MMELPLFQELDPSRREAVRQQVQLLIDERELRRRPSKEKEEANQILGRLEGLKSSLKESEPSLPKRQAQRLRKEYSALEMYYIKEMKRG